MNPRQRFERAQELFLRARELEPAARPAFLDDACRGDPELREELDRLLLHDGRQDAFVDAPLGAADAAHPLRARLEALHGQLPAPEAPPMPRSIGGFRLRRKLGEGGMGAVYEAEQEHPRRTVALKLLQGAVFSPQALRRFALEGEYLGRLQHPGIAQIFESGEAQTEFGAQPYFAMELVRGEPLTDHARNRALSVRERLELLARVADAVQHAHQQGVIHRDLKPENILVEASGNPKILDFGIARASDSDVRLTLARTDVGQILGTLAYMSPEQASGDPAAIDTRSDVYSLGVLLYELLADRLPYDVSGRSLPEAVRLIQEAQPQRLSAVRSLHRGDVETIVGRALEKDRERRYASAAALADDLRRYLRHEPITARRPSRLYTVGKFVRRNKTVVVATGSVLLALAIGLVLALRFGLREQRVRRASERDSYALNLPATVQALARSNFAAVQRAHRAAPEALRDWEWGYLDRRWLRPAARVTLPGVRHAACLDEGRVLGVGERGALHVWDALEGTVSVTPADGALDPPWPAGERPLALSADGRALLTWRAGALAVGDPLAEQPPTTYPFAGHEPKAGPSAAALTSDGALLAVATVADEVFLLDPVRGARRLPVDEPRQEVHFLELDAQGQLLVVGAGASFRGWDVETLSATWKEPVRGPLGFAPGAGSFALETYIQAGAGPGLYFKASSDGLTFRRLGRLEYGARHARTCVDLAFSPTPELVALSYESGELHLLDATAGVAWPTPASYREPSGALLGFAEQAGRSDLRLSFSPGAESLLSLGLDDGALCIWPTDGVGRVWGSEQNYVYSVAVSPDGATLASGAWRGDTWLWDAASGEPLARLPVAGSSHGLAFSTDGRQLACRSWEGIVVVDAVLARQVAHLGAARPGGTGIAYSPDGTLLAATMGAAVAVWDARTYEQRCVLDAGDGVLVIALAFDRDASRLATGSASSEIRLWDPRAGTQLASAVLERPGRASNRGALGLCFAPDGEALAVASADASVTLLDVPSLAETRKLLDHSGEAFSVAFSPGGTRLASGGRDGLLRVWDPNSGELLARLEGHDRSSAKHVYIKALAFSPDGSRIVTGSGDETLRIWDSVPVDVRWRERRRAERARPAAERLVALLYEQLAGDAAAVVARIERDGALDPLQRRLALRAVLRREAQPAGPR